MNFNKRVQTILFILLLGALLFALFKPGKKDVPHKNDELEEAFQKEKENWKDFLSSAQTIEFEGQSVQWNTRQAGKNFIEQYEKENGKAEEGQYKGNVYIDKKHAFLFTMSHPERWNGMVSLNNQKVKDPDGALARLYMGDSITFEVHEGNFQQPYDVETYTKNIYLPSYIQDTAAYPNIQFDYQTQASWFSLFLNPFRLQGEVKILMDGNRVLVGRIRYPKGKSGDSRVQELRESLASLAVIKR